MIAALIVRLASAPVRHGVRSLLGLALAASSNPPPSVGRVLVLALHNIPIAAWPLLLGVLGVQRHGRWRTAADVLVGCWIVANTAPVGAAFGAYGTRLVAFVPQLPLEWAALATGATGWMLERSGRLTPRLSVLMLAGCVGLMLVAAIVETLVPPHRR